MVVVACYVQIYKPRPGHSASPLLLNHPELSAGEVNPGHRTMPKKSRTVLDIAGWLDSMIAGGKENGKGMDKQKLDAL